MRHSSISFGKTTVTKITTPELMGIEAEKTRRAFCIGRDCGLFRVPQLLDFDEERGVAIFEKLAVKPVIEAVPWGEKKVELAKCLGTSLAIIHRTLKLPAHMRLPLPGQFALARDEVFLHGDLSVKNVCIGDSWPPIVILDWQMTPLYGGQATYGTRYFDVMWFINNLVNIPSNRFFFCNPVRPVAKAFISCYFREASIPYDPKTVFMYAKQFFDVEMARIHQTVIPTAKGRGQLLLLRSHMILKQFMKSLLSFSNV